MALANCLQFNVEYESGIGRYVVSHAFVAIAQVRWYNQLAFSSDFHVLYANVPALDNFSLSKSKFERFARLTCVELFAILLQTTRVVDVNRFAFFRLWTFAFFEVFNYQTTCQFFFVTFLSLFNFEKIIYIYIYYDSIYFNFL